MDLLPLLTRLPIPWVARCRVPDDPGSVTTIDPDEAPRDAGTSRATVERIWRAAESLYQTGAHPAIQVCIRRHGVPILHRAIGHSWGNAPQDPPETARQIVGLDTPFTLYSAAKAVTAMVVLKLDELRAFHLEDRICEYVPAFDREGKRWITIRHVLTHRAGIPNLPPQVMDLELLGHPEKVIEVLARAPRASRPGALVQYHAVSGGFVLAEVVRRATGEDIATVLEREICKPLGLRWLRYGVRPDEIHRVAHDAVTGPPVLPPLSTLLRRALGASMNEVVALARDPRFLTGIVPSANVVANAWELCRFYECLLRDGELDGVRVFDPRTVRHATNEQSYHELDLTLFVPLRYGMGLMLGDRPFGIFGPDTPRAFGHLGFTNIFGWADPERQISVAILTSGKPILSVHILPLLKLLTEINRLPRSRGHSHHT